MGRGNREKEGTDNLNVAPSSVITQQGTSSGAGGTSNSPVGSFPPFRIYKYKEIQKITDHFSTKLGGGASSTVFAGQLATGQLGEIAKQQFDTELETLFGLSHQNVIRLVGYCLKKGSHLWIHIDGIGNGQMCFE
ncbi:hypothetical protein ACFE04_004989 [Oxalis oulophora]